MTISIDWLNRIILVPKNDLTLVQAAPVEIREMNLNWFRLKLKELENSPEGMVNPDTHNHNTEVTLGGLTFARVIEMINGYTITFEDGQYAVNLVGANSNVGDTVNVNQVSVRSQNSAGMVTSQDMVYGSYDGGVHIDYTSPYSGTTHPVGTPRRRVNNLADAMLIATYNGFHHMYVYGDMLIDSGGNYQGKVFSGESPTKTALSITASSNVYSCEFEEAYINGTLDGRCSISRCLVGEIFYLEGYVTDSLINPEYILLGSEGTAFFLRCGSGLAGDMNHLPVIDMDNGNMNLIMRDYTGCVLLINKTTSSHVSIDLLSGQVRLDLETVTAGEVMVRGVGELLDHATGDEIQSGTYGDLVVINTTINPKQIATSVWSDTDASTLLSNIDFIKNVEGGRWKIVNNQMIFYKEDNSTELMRFNLYDSNGNPAESSVFERTRA